MQKIYRFYDDDGVFWELTDTELEEWGNRMAQYPAETAEPDASRPRFDEWASPWSDAKVFESDRRVFMDPDTRGLWEQIEDGTVMVISESLRWSMDEDADAAVVRRLLNTPRYTLGEAAEEGIDAKFAYSQMDRLIFELANPVGNTIRAVQLVHTDGAALPDHPLERLADWADTELVRPEDTLLAVDPEADKDEMKYRRKPGASETEQLMKAYALIAGPEGEPEQKLPFELERWLTRKVRNRSRRTLGADAVVDEETGLTVARIALALRDIERHPPGEDNAPQQTPGPDTDHETTLADAYTKAAMEGHPDWVLQLYAEELGRHMDMADPHRQAEIPELPEGTDRAAFGYWFDSRIPRRRDLESWNVQAYLAALKQAEEARSFEQLERAREAAIEASLTWSQAERFWPAWRRSRTEIRSRHLTAEKLAEIALAKGREKLLEIAEWLTGEAKEWISRAQEARVRRQLKRRSWWLNGRCAWPQKAPAPATEPVIDPAPRVTRRRPRPMLRLQRR